MNCGSENLKCAWQFSPGFGGFEICETWNARRCIIITQRKKQHLKQKILPDKKLKCYGICIQHNFITYAHDKEKKRKKDLKKKHSRIEGIQLSHNLGCGEKSPSQIPAPNSHKPQKSQIAQFRAISPPLQVLH